MRTEQATIVLVDDHDILMDGIASLLEDAPGVKVIGKASSAAAAEALIRKWSPTLVLTDISMGAVSGIDLARSATAYDPAIGIIILSMHDDTQHITAAFEAGARGYLLKNVKGDELLCCIEKVRSGEIYIQRSLAQVYAKAMRGQGEAAKKSLLSPRELEIIRLIARDLSTVDISRQLFLSEHTVETHRKNICRKTGTRSVVGLLNYAREHGII